MRYGTPFSAGYGSPGCACLVQLERDANGLSILATITPATGCGDALFGVYLNAQWFGNYTIAEGESKIVRLPMRQSNNSIYVYRWGHGDSQYSHVSIGQYDDTLDARRVTLSWPWLPAFRGPLLASGALDTDADNWTLTSPSVTALALLSGQRYYAPYSVTVSGGVASVLVGSVAVPLASGSGAVGTTITLSGTLSGTVDISSGCASHAGQLFWHFPSAMNIIRGTSNPPSAVVATKAFDQTDNTQWTEPADLAAGTYFYALQSVSAEGEPSAQSSAIEEDISVAPAPPTSLHYVSSGGGSASVAWTASVTPGATYTVYTDAAHPGSLQAVTTTAGTSASVSVPSDGTVNVLVRATDGVLEESNGNMLALTFVGGVYQAAQPNIPSIGAGTVSETNGRTLSVQALYDASGEAAAGVTAQLFTRAPGGSYTLASPDATGTLAALSSQWKAATLSYTFPSDGYFFVALCVATTSGVQGPLCAEVEIYVNATPAAAPGFTARKTRG